MPELERPHNSDETISQLHHMSTTAGMGSGEYVEINPLAITSIILAGLSLLGIVFLPFLLLGAAGAVAGVYALVKIRRSNGTQGGRLIASLGIALSVLICGGEGVRQAMMHSQNQRDSQKIQAVVQQLGDHLAKRDFVQARNMFGEEFRKRISQELFTETFKSVIGLNDVGEFQGLEAKGTFKFLVMGNGTRVGSTMIQVKFEKKTLDFTRVDLLMNEQGDWNIYNLPVLFQSVPKLE